MACGGQLACLLVYAVDIDGVGILIGGEEEVARRVYAKVTGDFALSGFCRHEGEFASRLVNGKEGDAVVTAIGAIEKLARRMHLYLGSIAVAMKVCGEGGECLNLLEGS